ncbi:MAG TPA: hypothetical protein VFZ33_19665, partial [Chitinophagaceae bacterium]
RPKKLTIAQFVDAGADEIQHVTSLFAGQPRDRRVFDAEIRPYSSLLLLGMMIKAKRLKFFLNQNQSFITNLLIK